jgi:hypothetical protein
MAAPKGNQFWKIRSSHGRDKLFETPSLLLEACEHYFNWVDSHPLYKVEALRGGEKAGELIKVPTQRPYTIQGLCRYLNCNSLWFNQFERSLKDKADDVSQDYSTIITHVREIIYQQKFEGAAIGAFNANIIARELGLREQTELMGKGGGPIKTEHDVNDGEIDYSKLSEDVLEAIAHARIIPQKDS